jgi:hypothetical protein
MNWHRRRAYLLGAIVPDIGAFAGASGKALAGCSALPDHDRLRAVLQSVVKGGPRENGGMGNQEWRVIMNRNGIACTVVLSGDNRSKEWPGSPDTYSWRTAKVAAPPDFFLSR